MTDISVQNFTFYKSHSCPHLNLSFIASLSGRYNPSLFTVEGKSRGQKVTWPGAKASES